MSTASVDVLLFAKTIKGSLTVSVSVPTVVKLPSTTKLPVTVRLPPNLPSPEAWNCTVGVTPTPICVVDKNNGLLLPKPSVILFAPVVKLPLSVSFIRDW